MSESVPQESKTNKMSLESFPSEEKVKCPHINKQGSREGEMCGRNAARGEKYCSSHLKDQDLVSELKETQRLAKQEGKVSVTIEPVRRDSPPEVMPKNSIPIIPLYPQSTTVKEPLPVTSFNMQEELILIMKYQSMAMYNFSEMLLNKMRK
jgi:hypothetical protein